VSTPPGQQCNVIKGHTDVIFFFLFPAIGITWRSAKLWGGRDNTCHSARIVKLRMTMPPTEKSAHVLAWIKVVLGHYDAPNTSSKCLRDK
jgi:hypothetical protein